MLRVALTGGMGSGKTEAAAFFRGFGCFVSQSDEVARAMMQPGEPVYRQIAQAFGAEVLTPEGKLDRRHLAKIAFAEGRLEELNAIVHPAVIAHQAAWMRGIEELHPRAVVMIESALVFETRHGAAAEAGSSGTAPWRTRFDRIVLVTADEGTRIDRYIRRVHASSNAANVDRSSAEADARLRMRAQMSEAEKEALSDYVVRNDGTLEALQIAVRQVYERLRQESEDRAEESM